MIDVVWKCDICEKTATSHSESVKPSGWNRYMLQRGGRDTDTWEVGYRFHACGECSGPQDTEVRAVFKAIWQKFTNFMREFFL